jgi:hypothetical protein
MFSVNSGAKLKQLPGDGTAVMWELSLQENM